MSEYLKKEGVTVYVTITLPEGEWVRGRNHFHGPVISMSNSKVDPALPDDWYVEFTDDKWGYCYIKQRIDGVKDATFVFTGPIGEPLPGEAAHTAAQAQIFGRMR